MTGKSTTTTLDYRHVGRVCAIYSNREEPRMWGLRKMLFPAPAVGTASAHSHRRATLFVRRLWETVHTARPLEHAPEAARASPQARACLSKLRQGVCYSRLPEGNTQFYNYPFHCCGRTVLQSNCSVIVFVPANSPWNEGFFFFFLRRYNFGEVLAFSINSFNLYRFLMQSFQLVILTFATSLFTSSSHLFLGLPSDLVNAGDHSYTLLTMLSSGIRCTCKNHTNLCALM